jgi:hypothetical protein
MMIDWPFYAVLFVIAFIVIVGMCFFAAMIFAVAGAMVGLLLYAWRFFADPVPPTRMTASRIAKARHARALRRHVLAVVLLGLMIASLVCYIEFATGSGG